MPESVVREVLAIVPARGGSKGIPRKNLQPLAGRPLLVHTLEQALATQSISRLVVSTDDLEIGHVARDNGAEVVIRPDDLAGDLASSESALLHVLDDLEASEAYRPELVVFLQCTSPIRHPDDIDKAVQLLLREKADSLLSVVPFHGFTWRPGLTGAEPINYDPRSRPRRQDRATEYLENGSIYVFKPWVLRQEGSRLGGRIALFEMSPRSSIDIDRPADLELCASILRQTPRSPGET